MTLATTVWLRFKRPWGLMRGLRVVIGAYVLSGYWSPQGHWSLLLLGSFLLLMGLLDTGCGLGGSCATGSCSAGGCSSGNCSSSPTASSPQRDASTPVDYTEVRG
jgi:hypothetical protein